ncbi:hypothetical protein [Algoriella xinjiangensis]|uniref:Uncharacterized protein n=1 Tax=Algoriella xinjiangensis TaxID=684065 RepID=A0A1I4XS33_9FLAO|nr:hypothetical protein [Algoriella xinjiangensis]SFN28624.1 hypothetical protein SAMN05421738_109149 [Algoriella xinjiangensis]
MKIRINTTPEGAIVRNQNFDKIGKTPFEIDKEDYLGQKIFINYDGIIKEFVINENTNFIEESFRKTINQNEEEVYTSDGSTIDALNPNTPSSNNKLYMIGGIVAVLGFIGLGYWFFDSKTDEKSTTIKTEVVEQNETEKSNIENSVEFVDKNEVEQAEKPKEEKSKIESKKVEENKPASVAEVAPKTEEKQFSEEQAKAIIKQSISLENNKNANGLVNLFSSKIKRYKSKNNLSKNQLISIFNEWWNTVVFEDKQVAGITALGDNTYKVKINYNYQVEGGNEKNVIYYGIYQFDKNGKIIELYID